MEIFGVGFPEVIVIFILLLTVAGPKRMIRWAYVLGQYTARARQMFGEAMEAFKREMEAAGIDEIRKDLDLRQEVTTLSNNLSGAVAETNQAVQQASDAANTVANNTIVDPAPNTSVANGNGTPSADSSATPNAPLSEGQPSQQERYDSWQVK